MYTENETFSSYIDDIMVVYLDDILVYSRAWGEHNKIIYRKYSVPKRKKFYGKLDKCVFGVDEVEYLGFKLKNSKLLIDPTKVLAVRAWETLTYKQDFQSFLGKINLH